MPRPGRNGDRAVAGVVLLAVARAAGRDGCKDEEEELAVDAAHGGLGGRTAVEGSTPRAVGDHGAFRGTTTSRDNCRGLADVTPEITDLCVSNGVSAPTLVRLPVPIPASVEVPTGRWDAVVCP